MKEIDKAESIPSSHTIEHNRELDKRNLFAFNYGLSKQVFNQILGKLK